MGLNMQQDATWEQDTFWCARNTRTAALVRLVLASLVVAFGLVGCAQMIKPATTEGLLVHYAANPANDNFHASGGVDLGVSMLGVRQVVPVTVAVDAAGGAAHGTVTADLSALDSPDITVEYYLEQLDDSLVLYTAKREGDATAWTSRTFDMVFDIASITKLLSAADFSRVSLSSDSSVCYELTVPATTIFETLPEATNNPKLFEELDINVEKTLDALEGDKVSANFTEDCLLRSVATDLTLPYDGSLIGHIPVTIRADCDLLFDGYGTVDSAEVKIPASVKKSAVPADPNESFEVTSLLDKDSPLGKRINKQQTGQ